ncbi:MAG: hypothetical protein QM758_05125 [Armatimonas sp.]
MAGYEWEPNFALAAYFFALKHWGGKSSLPLYVPKDLDPALWTRLKRLMPRLEREPQSRPIGARTLSLENRWMYPAQEARYRFVGITISTAKAKTKDESANSYETWILEARRVGGSWHFRPLSSDPPLPRAAELVLYKKWAIRGQRLLVNGSESLVKALRAQGIDARPYTTQDAEARRQGFLYLDVLTLWWTDAKTVYVRVDRMHFPPGNDVAYESYGSVRLSHKDSRWILTDLGDWQGE